MLSSVLSARDAYLKPGGRLYPSRASLTVGAVSDAALWADKVGWWGDVYGYDLRALARHAFPEPIVEPLPAAALASAPPHARVADFDIAAMRADDQDVRGARFALAVAPSADGAPVLVHALAVWFDVTFGDERYWPAGAPAGAAAAPAPAPAVVLDTAPAAAPTHWMQTVLLLRTPLALPPAGGALAGALSMVRDAENPRTYRFSAAIDAGAHGAAVQQAWHMK